MPFYLRMEIDVILKMELTAITMVIVGGAAADAGGGGAVRRVHQHRGAAMYRVREFTRSRVAPCIGAADKRTIGEAS